LDLPVYLRPQRTVGLTGGVAATQWNYGRHLLAAFSRKIFLHLPGPATACSATMGSKLPLAAFESQRILGRGPERPLSLGCPFLFAGAANGGSPPFVSGVMNGPQGTSTSCGHAAAQRHQTGHSPRIRIANSGQGQQDGALRHSLYEHHLRFLCEAVHPII
jgi:hypothetical protein